MRRTTYSDLIMNENSEQPAGQCQFVYDVKKLAKRIFKIGLTRTLLFWFLLLALLPVTVVSWFSYQQSQQSLYTNAIDAMTQRTALQSQFLKNWFDYRFIDLQSQAENHSNVHFLQQLVQALQVSGKSPAEFIDSYQWARIAEDNKTSLVSLSRIYDYYYDVFLIDNQGNILFTLAKEQDLGTNLFTGPYHNTRFAHVVRKSLDTGQALFSDLEHYAPSNNTIAGFLTAPLLDENGQKIGLFAVQFEIDKINEIMTERTGIASSEVSYLLGTDLLLRSAKKNQSNSHVLETKIDTEQSQRWLKHVKQRYMNVLPEKHEIVFSYLGVDGQRVLGIHHEINLGNVEWSLIAEIDESEALAPAQKLAKWTASLLFVVFILVLVLAVLLANKLVQPLHHLLEASQRVAEGKLNQKVEVAEENEIGQLAESFNQMLVARQDYEGALESVTRRSQQALDELAEQKFALDQHAIVAITDIKGNISFVNEKFSEISGYSSGELIGRNHRLLNSGHHPTEFFRRMYRTIAHGEVWQGEIYNKAKDGHHYWVDTTIVPFLGTDGKPKSYVAIRTDISVSKQTELELIKARDAAEAATRQKAEFLANMSHEIRTPMNGVIGMTGLLLETDLTPQQRSYADTTLNSADALLTLINDILDFSKIEAGKMELEEVAFDLQTLAEDVAELMAIKCRKKKVEMLLRYKPGTCRYLIGDPGRIRQIMLNLLSNATKFTEQGYISLTIEADRVSQDISTIRVSVEDTGIGIAEDKQEIIFNKFDQADGSTTRKYGGTGLGLSISKQLSEMMGGGISISSRQGEGAIFSFTMKLRNNTNKDATAISILNDYSVFSELKALIVDDTETARIILTEQISDLKMNVETASSGDEALAKLMLAIKQNAPFDVVITDYHMPGMDGEMLAEEISNIKSIEDIALIFVTSSPRRGDGKRLKAMGFSGYLTKPTHPGEISKILSVIWAARQQGKTIQLVTRHTIQEVKTRSQRKAHFFNTHILLVEDNPVNQMVASEMLTRCGCTVTPAGNGIEALQMFMQRKFDMIYMDCQMPEMDGFEATSCIREQENSTKIAKTPIVAFTANAMQGDKEACLAAGMDDYVSKPISQEALEKTLVKWLPNKLSSKLSGEIISEEESIEEKVSSKNISENDIFDLIVYNNLKQLFGVKFTAVAKQHSITSVKNIKKAQNAIQANDADELEKAMHSLKSSCRQFGAIGLGDLAEKIEECAKENNMVNASDMLSELIVIHEHVEQLMEQLSARESDSLNVQHHNEVSETTAEGKKSDLA